MEINKFNKSKLATSLSLVLGIGCSLPLAAEETPAEQKIEVIEVQGIRSSLVRSMDVKKGSDGVVDAITADDIGKFPDSNLAESLQRITGVSIDRVNGEGSSVSVRGFGPQFNLVTLNNRQMPVTTGTRSFDFANIAAESISSVEVYKTSLASLPTGGIGSTINVLTHRPMNSPGLVATMGIKAVDDTSTEEGSITPEISGLYSNTNDDDTFGVSISASYQKRESGNRQAQVGTGWRSFPGTVDNDWANGTAEWGGVPQENQINRPGEGDIYSVPQTTIYRFEEQQRERINGQLVLQYRPVDSVKATLDYTYMQNDVDTQYNDISAWYTFAPSENTWTDGPISSPLIYSENYGTPQDLSMAGGDYGVRNQSGSLGLNLEWEVNENLTLNFDAHNSYAENKPNNPFGSSNILSTAGFVRTSAATDFSGDLPILAVGGGNAIQASDMRVTGSVFTNTINRSEIDQYQATGEYVFDELPASIDFGIAFTDVSNRTQEAVVQRNDWGGVGNAGDFEDEWFPASTIHDRFDASGGNFGGSSDYDILNTIFFWNFHDVRNRAEQLYSDGMGMGDCGSNFCPSSDYASNIDRYTEEKSQAAFIQFNYDDELWNMPYNLHIGLRYEKTKVDSTSAVTAYNRADWVADTEIALNKSGQVFESQQGDYDYWLPNFNFNIEVYEDVMMRLAYSKTIGRPDYVSIQGGTVVGQLGNQAGVGANKGNPSLLPVESTNYDFSTEWYYSDSGYASIGYFRKDTKNYSTGVVQKENYTDVANPTAGPRYQAALDAVGPDAAAIRAWIFENYADDPFVDVANQVISGNPAEDDVLVVNNTVAVNSAEKVTVDGFEFAVQHFFGDSGFGMIANYTLVNSGDEYNNFLLEDQPIVVGISDTANAILIYEDYGFQGRLAYNWRDQFLSSRGQGTGANPQYTEPYSQIDFSVTYQFEDDLEGLSVTLDALNITDEHIRVHGRAEEQLLNLVETGARYSLGVRYTF